MKCSRYGDKNKIFRILWKQIIPFLIIVVIMLLMFLFAKGKDRVVFLLATITALHLVCIVAIGMVRKSKELFGLEDDGISTLVGKRQQKIELPSSCVLVISYADIVIFGESRTGHYKTPLLKGQYAVSILAEMSVETVLNKIHKTYAPIYATSTIRRAFGDSVIYSFVCNEDLLNSLANKRSGSIVIPESLENQVSFHHINWTVCIDRGY